MSVFCWQYAKMMMLRLQFHDAVKPFYKDHPKKCEVVQVVRWSLTTISRQRKFDQPVKCVTTRIETQS